MKHLRFVLCSSILLISGIVSGQTTLPDVAPSLKAYYDDGTKLPPWKEAVAQLSAAGPEVRQAAGTYLRLLLGQSLNDEKSGVAPWRATPYWGQSGENPARELRKDIIRALSDADLSDQAVPVLGWYIDGQENHQFAAEAANALAKIAGPQADALLTELASRPHANCAVVTTALEQAARRKLTIKPEPLLASCQNHRSQVRNAALATAKQLGIVGIPDYSDAQVMKSAAIRKIMDALSALIVEPPESGARFSAVTETWFEDGKKTEEPPVRGWVIEDKDAKVTLLTPFGKRKTFEIAERPKPAKYNGASFTCVCAALPIDQEVARVASLRKKEDPDFELSERGGLTGQFQGRAAGLYEVELAHWLYSANRLDLAAKVLLPALDTMYEDQDLVEMARARLGVVYGYRMLASFAGDRDYSQTAKWAGVMQEKFPGAPFALLAKELARQIPLRAEDFKALKLPDAKEWEEQQKKLDRTRQIEYLCDRLRLLNCFQSGQPGGVDLHEKQYAEPSGITDDAAWGKDQGKTELINPLVELDKQKLTNDDIPLLTPYLKDDWFILAVEFWRDFSAEREVLRTRPILADLINGLAGKDICSDYEMAKMNAADVAAYIGTINQYARDNRGRSEADLLLATLEQGAGDGSRWFDVRWKAYRLVELRDKRAAPVILKYLKGRKISDYDIEDVLANARKSDPSELKAVAANYLDNHSMGVRVEAALSLLGTDQGVWAHDTLGDVLAKADATTLSEETLPVAVSALLNEHNEEARKAALRVFEGTRLGTIRGDSRIPIIKAFAAAGMADGLRYYLKLLDLPGKGFGGVGWGEPVWQVFTDEILNSYDPSDAGLKKIAAETAGKPEQATAAVRQWLQGKIKAIDANTTKPVEHR